jgi:hypothetical protein
MGTDKVDILGDGIFETDGSAFRLPSAGDTNFDSVTVGNDFAQAIGAFVGGGPGGLRIAANAAAVQAANELEIKKNQDSGDCECCQALNPACPCQDCCTKYNIEEINVGSRTAQAIGAGVGGGPGGLRFALNAGSVSATNSVRIITNQQ